jgi:hypothetical protein
VFDAYIDENTDVEWYSEDACILLYRISKPYLFAISALEHPLPEIVSVALSPNLFFCLKNCQRNCTNLAMNLEKNSERSQECSIIGA